MNTADFKYLGELRTESTHLRSGNSIVTDAPTDNHGKGEAFSPTDLVATSLVTCMITVMGIKAEKHGMDMGEVTGTVKKVMASEPRRVAQLNVEITIKGHRLSSNERNILEKTAITCPVSHSLHPDINQHVKFSYE